MRNTFLLMTMALFAVSCASSSVAPQPPVPPQPSYPPQQPHPPQAPNPWAGGGYRDDKYRDQRGYDPRYHGKKRQKSFLENLFD